MPLLFFKKKKRKNGFMELELGKWKGFDGWSCEMGNGRGLILYSYAIDRGE